MKNRLEEIRRTLKNVKGYRAKVELSLGNTYIQDVSYLLRKLHIAPRKKMVVHNGRVMKASTAGYRKWAEKRGLEKPNAEL